jgi:archaellum component FlaC
MKSVLLFTILLCVIASQELEALTPEDLDKIRLIVNEELKSIRTDITTLKTDVASQSGSITGVEKQVDGIQKQMTFLMALIVVAVGIPQIMVAWRSRKDREYERRIEELAREIEVLKQQRIVNPMQ